MKKIFFLLMLATLHSCALSPEVDENSSEQTELKNHGKNSHQKPISHKKKNLNDTGMCICMEVYEPVCGKDKKTYSNSCFARCQGVSFIQGACAQ